MTTTTSSGNKTLTIRLAPGLHADLEGREDAAGTGGSDSRPRAIPARPAYELIGR